jgi:hypothetical protein
MPALPDINDDVFGNPVEKPPTLAKAKEQERFDLIEKEADLKKQLALFKVFRLKGNGV